MKGKVKCLPIEPSKMKRILTHGTITLSIMDGVYWNSNIDFLLFLYHSICMYYQTYSVNKLQKIYSIVLKLYSYLILTYVIRQKANSQSAQRFVSSSFHTYLDVIIEMHVFVLMTENNDIIIN